MTHGMGMGSETATARAAAPPALWDTASRTLRKELGEGAFASWLSQASLRESSSGALVLVTPTGFARDWIRRNCWRRVSEVLSQTDGHRRRFELKSRTEFEADGPGETAASEPVPALEPVGEAPVAARPAKAPGLQARFTFDSFVAGPQNDFALTVARRVADWRDPHFHTVLIHGPYGFGKTHLLNAIAWAAKAHAPDKTVVYMPAERFLSGFVKAVMDRSTGAFKEEVRSADLLLIDDVQFISGKPSSQEELFHTVNALVEDGRRVVISSDRCPSAMTEMDGRLRSHLASGLVCGIEAYDRNLRIAIIGRKLELLARRQGVEPTVKPEVLALVADRFAAGDVRELEGALNTLVMRAEHRLGALTVDEADAAIRPHLKGGERRVTVDEIQKLVCDHYGLRQADLLGQSRTRSVARPRQAAMWLAKQLTTRSYPDIGRRFGGRDHTTVLHACRKIEALKATDAGIAADLETLTRKLRG